MSENKHAKFLTEVQRLLKECERRDDTIDLTVIEYMIRRIRSCQRSLRSITLGWTLNVEQALLFDLSDIEELLTCFQAIETQWVQKKDDAETRSIGAEETKYLRSTVIRSGKVGRPRYQLDADQVFNLKRLGFTRVQIAKILGVDERTIYNHFGPLKVFPPISDDELDSEISSIKKTHPDAGERMVEGILLGKGIKVIRKRLRNSIHRVDPVDAALRWMRSNPRWIYSVAGPNALWHNDGLHKLIRYGFVIHACIDGYSRMCTSLHCATNNQAITALKAFNEGVQKYGLPERVRGDNGTENNEIERYMEHHRGGGSYIRGPSVHNQRIERLHYDTTHCALAHFIDLFQFLEDNDMLDPNDKVDLFCLHYIFLKRIQQSLDEFRDGWNSHRVSTCGNKTPAMIFMLGVMDQRNRSQIGVESVINGDWSTYGIEPYVDEEDNEEPTVELHDIHIGDGHDDILSALRTHLDPCKNDGNYGVDIYDNVRALVRSVVV